MSAPSANQEVYHPPRKIWIEIIVYIFCGLVCFFLILPLFIVLPISFSSSQYLEFPPRGFSLQWYTNFFMSNEWTRAMINSAKIATMTSVLSCLLGIPAALAMTRQKFKWAQFIYSFLISSMIVPVIIIAIAVYFFFARLHFVGNIYAIVLGHTILAIPIVVITVSVSLQGIDKTLEYAAMGLGANRLKTFFKITFPLIKPGVISGALFAFIVSFDEVLIAIFLGGPFAMTLPRYMFASLRTEIDPTIAAVSSILVFFAIFFLLSVTMLRRWEKGKR